MLMYIPNVGARCEVLLDSEVMIKTGENKRIVKAITDDNNKKTHKIILPKGLILVITEMSNRGSDDCIRFKIENDIMGLKKKWMLCLSRKHLNNNINVKWL